MKRIPSILLIGFLFVLSACATPAGAATPVKPTPTPSIFSTGYADALPVASQLALGTLRLKGTADDLTTDEAASLLLLWKGMVAVSNSTNPSQFEINGVIGQIQQTMTPAQIQSIASMKLTNAEINTTVQAMGLTFGGGRGFGGANGAGATGANRAGATGGTGGNNNRGGGGGGGGQFFFGGGGIPGGGGGGAGFGGIPSSGQTANNSSNNSAASAGSTQATVQARATQRALVGNTFLYNIVVNYLESIVPGAAPATATPTPAQ